MAAVDLDEGLMLWSRIDSRWLTTVDRPAFDTTLRNIGTLPRARVLGSHLPPATAMTADLLRWIGRVTDAEETGLAALQQILAQVHA